MLCGHSLKKDISPEIGLNVAQLRPMLFKHNHKSLKHLILIYICAAVTFIGPGDKTLAQDSNASQTSTPNETVKIWDLRAAYSAVKREFYFIEQEQQLTALQIYQKTLVALEFIEILRAYLIGNSEVETTGIIDQANQLEYAEVKKMATDVHQLLAQKMMETLGRNTSLRDGLASKRVVGFYSAFDTKINERLARFATEAEFRLLRSQDASRNESRFKTFIHIAARDPVLLTYLSLLDETLNYWAKEMVNIRELNSRHKLLGLGYASSFALSSGFYYMDGSTTALALMIFNGGMWAWTNNKPHRELRALIDVFRKANARYLPMLINTKIHLPKNLYNSFGDHRQCYQILSGSLPN